MLNRLTITFSFLFISLFLQAQGVRFAKINLTAAKQRAVIEDKLIFVDTYASYCKPCKQLDIEFKNPKLAEYLNKHFINVKVDMEGKNGPSFKNGYQVVFLPTMMILDKHGNLKFKIDQVASANEILALSKHYQDKIYPSEIAAQYSSVRPKTGTQITTKRPTTKSESAQPTATTISRSESEVRKTTSTTTAPAIEKKKEITIVNVAANNPSDEVIVHVIGADDNNLPPEILKQESYFRLELMDGSHRTTAHQYLATQDDWSTDENMRFLFDFVYTVNSDEFKYFIENRGAFSALIGQDQVDASVNIIVNNELERAYPRPDYNKALQLYEYINAPNAKANATEYHLSNILDSGNAEEYVQQAEQYINDSEVSNADIYHNVAKLTLVADPNKKELKKVKSYIEKSISLNDKNSNSLLLLSEVELLLKNNKSALELANQALSLARTNGEDITDATKMINKLNSL